MGWEVASSVGEGALAPFFSNIGDRDTGSVYLDTVTVRVPCFLCCCCRDFCVMCRRGTWQSRDMA